MGNDGESLQAGHWVISETSPKIILATQAGIITPDSLSIWEAEFEGNGSIAGFQVSSPSTDLPQLEFSRFPIDLVVVLTGTAAEGLNIRIVGIDGTRVVDIPTSDTDQLIIENTWYPIDRPSSAKAFRILGEENISVPGKINIGQLIWLRGNDRLPILVRDLTENTEAAKVRLPKIDIPELKAELFSYQEVGVSFLASVAGDSIGCVLADEMGLGKTLQVIALLLLEKAAGRRPNLIVCPATLLENWRREINTFAPSLSVLTHAGSERTGNPATFSTFDVVIVSYETCVRDEPLLSSAKWNVLALDEAQNIKNPDAQRTAATKQLPRRVSIAITGTPVENRLTDLWSIADFVLPGLLGSKASFESEYDDSHQDASRLAPLVSPILLRRRVSEVATDLPPRIDIPQAVAMTRQMAEQYEEIRQEIEDSYAHNARLVALGKLRQFCAHPSLLGVAWQDPAQGMPKYLRMIEILEEIFAKREKVLIFTSFTQMTDLILSDVSIRFHGVWGSYIDGRVPVDERQPTVDRFSATMVPAFLVLNPKAAGVGLNITAANHVIHYNPEWNPATEDQASARAHRRKQTKPVTIHHLYFADSVEEVVIDRLSLKRGLASGAVVGHRGDSDASAIARALKISPLASRGFLE